MTAANDNHTTKKMREAHEAYVANRKEAGRMIDVETCKYAMFRVNYFDPYGTYPWDDDPPDDKMSEQCRDDISKCWFVCSDASDGWIEWHDLPEEKQQALRRRMERERKPRECRLKLWEAACAAHPMYELVSPTHWLPFSYLEWKGDGEEPSWDALIEWFKVNHPAQASEAESKIKRELEIE